MKLITSKLTFALFLILSSLCHAGAESSASPELIINTLHDTLIKSMKNAKDLGYKGRYDLLEPVVNESFDFKTIGRIVLGRYWKELEKDQKDQFIDVFSDLSIATYANRFSGYTNETFEYQSKEEIKKRRFIVKTELVSQDRMVSFNYILHQKADEWRIINVIANGISDLSLKRADYTTIMKSEGFDGLVKKLLEKIEILNSAADEGLR